jgi:peptidoglycan/xylan/chitin deacetylase (PgdA/CDA1 family)
MPALQNTYGWEIGSHTVTHPILENQTQATITTELASSLSAMKSHALSVTGLAEPYGSYNDAVLATAARYYKDARTFKDTGFNAYPYDPSRLFVQQVQKGVSVATVKTWINQAVTNKQWLILVFHDIVNGAPTGAYEELSR